MRKCSRRSFPSPTGPGWTQPASLTGGNARGEAFPLRPEADEPGRDVTPGGNARGEAFPLRRNHRRPGSARLQAEMLAEKLSLSDLSSAVTEPSSVRGNARGEAKNLRQHAAPAEQPVSRHVEMLAEKPTISDGGTRTRSPARKRGGNARGEACPLRLAFLTGIPASYRAEMLAEKHSLSDPLREAQVEGYFSRRKCSRRSFPSPTSLSAFWNPGSCPAEMLAEKLSISGIKTRAADALRLIGGNARGEAKNLRPRRQGIGVAGCPERKTCGEAGNRPAFCVPRPAAPAYVAVPARPFQS